MNNRFKTPYEKNAYVAYFAAIRHLGIYEECVVPNEINKGGTRDTEKGHALYTAIYQAINKESPIKKNKATPIKPLFVPLKKTYFLKIESGEQDCEIRPNNHRAWNTKNVYIGRLITFSNGYGKHDRLNRTIFGTKVTTDLNAEKIPQWHIDAVEHIYGKRDSWLIAYI